MKDSKNQMIRSNKSFGLGGSSADCNSRDGGCGAKKAARKNKRRDTMRKIGKALGDAGGVLGSIAGGALAGGAGYGVYKLSQQKKGGAVKRTSKKK
jgi:hypothetical protein